MLMICLPIAWFGAEWYRVAGPNALLWWTPLSFVTAHSLADFDTRFRELLDRHHPR